MPISKFFAPILQFFYFITDPDHINLPCPFLVVESKNKIPSNGIPDLFVDKISPFVY